MHVSKISHLYSMRLHFNRNVTYLCNRASVLRSSIPVLELYSS